MQIRSIKLKDRNFGRAWTEQVFDRWDYSDFLAHPEWREDWISFDGVVYHAASDRVYFGITSFAGDIFKAYDRARGCFVDLEFQKSGDRYDAKFHRSMQLTSDGRFLYAATALLHDIDRFQEARGGSIYRHDTASGKTEKLATPIAHSYIQSIALDENRGFIYSLHFPPEYLSRFNLNTGETKVLGLVGGGMSMGQGESILLDDEGCLWCGWAATRPWQSAPGADAHRRCKFDRARTG
jgi:hypothetical protein